MPYHRPRSRPSSAQEQLAIVQSIGIETYPNPAFEWELARLNLRQFQEAIAAFTLALTFDPHFTVAQKHLAIAQSISIET